MDILKKIPHPALILGVLSLAAVLIMLSDPPKNACDAQLEVFFKAQAGRINSIRGNVRGLWARTAKYCQEAKTLGGCSEFHEVVRALVKDIKNAPVECVPRLLEDEAVEKTLLDSMTLMVQMAWGEEPPEIGPSTYGWMGGGEFELFCSLTNIVQRVLSEESWEAYVRKTISRLPHSSDLKFDDAFFRSLFSVRCDAVH